MVNDTLTRDFSVDWRIRDDIGISDHNTISIVLSRLAIDTIYDAPVMWPVSGVDWQYYSEQVRQMICETLSCESFREMSIDSMVERITEAVIQVNNTCSAELKPSIPRN